MGRSGAPWAALVSPTGAEGDSSKAIVRAAKTVTAPTEEGDNRLGKTDRASRMQLGTDKGRLVDDVA